ncbi:DeoR/GlpR family DNA-binding transcription regulator [Paenibacillus sp. N4]|uniref:DeoR/GlpR family DNA-binding transcription regulator n=1 Tax=Paenibacillus vietnamensis TaxID=2590547 RepID=UPI001CD0AEBA|nr:DeoR/GlpR family DNA-binding transcription regulator [Paenibacillus vietnamensis]MCA0755321.1 DeoR/GlpR family DNA-binding transcription regulator [Paenibacillus vietnamensis]
MADANGSKGQRRREALLQLLKQQGRITISEMVEKFGCSEATARRDLEQLESEYPVIRTIGGAMYDGMHTVRDLPFEEKAGLSILEKERIAALAASLIEEGDVIGLSGGTTNFLIAKQLKTRKGITVVTNAVNIAMELAGSQVQVVVTGGIMRHNSFELCGPLGEGTVSHLHIGKMFFGVDGISVDGGITIYSEQEAQICKALIKRSQEAYAVFDHTKTGKTSLFSTAALSELRGIITDMPLSPELAAQVEQHGISVYVTD